MVPTGSRTVVFITGEFLSHTCWDNWVCHFEANSYTAIAPPWPGKNASAETLRRENPDPQLAAITAEDVLSHYIAILTQLPEKPVVIGHSFGGLLCQLLLNKGYAAAAIAIHPIPPSGIVALSWKYIRSVFSFRRYFSSQEKTFLLPFRKWQQIMVNGTMLEDQKDAYYELVIPESKRLLRSMRRSSIKVDYAAPHHPLLLLAGEFDRYIPPSLVKRNYSKYKNANSSVDIVIRKRNHFSLGAATWQEDADYIINWLQSH